ncbi:hypothetical protein A6C57_08565 [Fibrella sp. ES10-3-2-2]|nr:hypothetical protein A6C57_08565 [Fibrella sp. ES10-3-2-2]
MIDNPFAVIDRRINRLESLLIEIKDALPKNNLLNNQLDQVPFGDFAWLQGACPGIPASTLRIKSAAGEIPGTKKVGKRVLYEKIEVLNWIRSLGQRPKLTAAELNIIAEVNISKRLAKSVTKSNRKSA